MLTLLAEAQLGASGPAAVLYRSARELCVRQGAFLVRVALEGYRVLQRL